MNKIFLMITLLVASFVSQGQSKDSAHLQFKKEKNEMKQAEHERLQLEKKQLMAKPEIIHAEKVSVKQTVKQQPCKTGKRKRSY